MAGCTAPRDGHRTASGAANCPVHRYSSRRGYGGYSTPSYYDRPSYTPPPAPVMSVAPPAPKRYPSFSRSSGGSGGGGSGRRRTSTAGRTRRSTVTYSVREFQTLNPVREQVVRIAADPIATDQRDLFLCHAWDDRQGSALELNNLLKALDVTVWFSEMDVPLGTSLIRKIDRGLASSSAGVVLVTPALFTSLNNDGIASQELSALLATDRVIPIVHGTTFEELRKVSPLLAARSGLTTSDYPSLEEVAAKIADTVLIDDV